MYYHLKFKHEIKSTFAVTRYCFIWYYPLTNTFQTIVSALWCSKDAEYSFESYIVNNWYFVTVPLHFAIVVFIYLELSTGTFTHAIHKVLCGQGNHEKTCILLKKCINKNELEMNEKKRFKRLNRFFFHLFY